MHQSVDIEKVDGFAGYYCYFKILESMKLFGFISDIVQKTQNKPKMVERYV